VDESDLSAYIDEALSEAKRARVEAHLRSCDDCARRLDELKQLVAELHALPRVAAPRSFALSQESVAALSRESSSGVERRKTAARRAYLGLSGATAVAAVLLVAAFGMDLLTSSNGGGPESLPAATSSDKSLAVPQAAVALPDATAPDFGAVQPGAAAGNLGQAAVPPVLPSGTVTAGPGQVIVPPATREKDALLPANQPTGAATPNALSAALPTVSPPGVATPAPALGETSAFGPQAQPAEKSASHAWLWVLEGAAGGLFIGFGLSAFWMRRRWVRINRDS
jgi:anti-sigma factor RsiW